MLPIEKQILLEFTAAKIEKNNIESNYHIIDKFVDLETSPFELLK